MGLSISTGIIPFTLVVLCFSMMLKKLLEFIRFDLLQDALRLYIINSPVVRAEPLRFKKDGVFGVVSIFCSLVGK